MELLILQQKYRRHPLLVCERSLRDFFEMLDHLVQVNDLEFLIPDLLVAAGEALRNHKLDSGIEVHLHSLDLRQHDLELGTALDFIGVSQFFVLNNDPHLGVNGEKKFLQLLQKGFTDAVFEEKLQLGEKVVELGLVSGLN